MRRRPRFIHGLSVALLLLRLDPAKPVGAAGDTNAIQTFVAKGTVLEIKPDGRVLIQHEAISNYMAAMTMPFKVRTPAELAGLHRGDQVSFQLHVAESESWVEHLTRIGSVSLPAVSAPGATPPVPSVHPLLNYPFTNELGQAVRLNDFRGQALAITFFYTRCPLPDYCQRLSKNFQATQEKMAALTNCPSNWHLLSVSFDTEFDTPQMLLAYAGSYHADPKRWSFLTGPADKIGELARQAGLDYQLEGGVFSHDLRTLIIDAAGHLQMVFPTSGDLSDQIVAELLKAAAVTNASELGRQKP